MRGRCAKRQLLPQAEKVGVDGRTSALAFDTRRALADKRASQIRPGRRASFCWPIGRAEAAEYIAPIIGTKEGIGAWVVVSCIAPIRCGFPPAAEQQTDSKRSDRNSAPHHCRPLSFDGYHAEHK